MHMLPRRVQISDLAGVAVVREGKHEIERHCQCQVARPEEEYSRQTPPTDALYVPIT